LSAFENVRNVYEQLGAEQPFWAVLSHSQYKSDVVDLDEFFATGRREVARQMKLVEAAPIELERGRALDFGCGVGRLTNALAEHFDEVVGVDISSTMIENADRLRRDDRCRFVVNTRDDLSVFPDQHFDFVYSDITLQHIPMPASGRYLADFVRLLRPGGLIICLVPDGRYRHPGSVSAALDQFYRQQWRPWWKRIRGKQPVQIHPIARKRVAQIVYSAGGEVVHTEVTPDFRDKKKPFKPLFYWIRRAEAATARRAA
jgi:ubiquinone/menaquinone biosynthesis C-methylase UbiE